MKNTIQFIEGPLKPELIAGLLSNNNALLNNGAYTIFCGKVRADQHDDGTVAGISYSCYQSMAQKILAQKLEEIKNSFQVSDVIVMHSVGFVPAGQISVILLVAAGHRKQSLDAQDALLPLIKFEVPIWKKEVYHNGRQKWST
jgi:molybdopterin synthase catalytic subunit